MTPSRKSRKTGPIAKTVTLWDKLTPGKQHAICLLFLFLLPVIQYHDVVFGGKKFFAHDIVQWRASAESIIEHRQEFGEEPLWSENMFSGMPAYMVSYVKSVPHLDQLFVWFHGINPVFQLWLMLLGLYLFLLRLKLHPIAATLGALLIAMTTYMPIITGAGHNAKINALVYIPWMLYGYHMLTRSDKRLLGLAVFAIAVNLELRAGHPQVTYFFLYLFAAWWIHDLIFAFKNKELPGWAKKTGLLVTAAVIALLCNVQPYWSIYEYSPYSIRGGTPAAETTGLNLDYAMAWSQGWFELSTFIIPNILGGSSQDNMYWGEKSVTSGPHYLGALAFFLALLALFRFKSSLKWVFLGAGILTLLFSLGKNFAAFNYLFFNYMPFYNKFRAPEMWLMVTTFSFNVLAAMGLHWLLTEATKIKDAGIRLIDAPAVIAVGAGVVYLILVQSTLTFEKPGEYQMLARQVAMSNNVEVTDPRVQQFVDNYLATEVIPPRRSKAMTDTLRYLLFIGLGLGLAWAFLSGRMPGYTASWGMILILSFDLISTGYRYIPENSKIDSSWDFADAIERQRQDYHTFIQETMEPFDYPYRVFPLETSAFNDAIPSYFYPSIGGYSGVKMNRYQDVIENAIFSEETALNFGVINMLNVRYLTAPEPYMLPGLEVVFSGGRGYVLENTNVLPKVFFPDSLVSASHPADALHFISRRFDPQAVSIVETGQLPPHSPDTLATFRATEYNARVIRMEIEKSSPGMAVLSEMYYPVGWMAFVNDEETDIYAVNYLLRGIFLDAGTHEVEFRFEPTSHYIGSKISWAANLLLIGLLALGIFFGRKTEPEAASA